MKKNYPIIICFLLLSCCNAISQIPTNSLVAYYPFNGNTNDSSGNGFNGFLNGQISVTGHCARAYRFSGNFISCGDPPGNEFDLVNNASISLWVKYYIAPPAAPSGGNSGYYTLIGKDVGPGNFNKWFLATYNDQLVFHINAFTFQSGGFWANQTIFPFALDTFYHVVVTKISNTYNFYVNGVYYGSQNLAQNIVDVNSPLRIGDLQDGGSSVNVAIDEVLIYRRALTLAEINQIYVYCPPVVITSSGTIIQDQSADFKIYPNPSSGKLVLSFANVQAAVKNVSVYNVPGEKVFTQQQRLYNQNMTIDLGTLPKGIYFLKVQVGKKIVIRKIVIQ